MYEENGAKTEVVPASQGASEDTHLGRSQRRSTDLHHMTFLTRATERKDISGSRVMEKEYERSMAKRQRAVRALLVD